MLKENKVYLFTKHEFLLLAAASGIHRLYGFDMEAEKLEQETAVYMLQNLNQKGFLQAVEDKFVLKKEIALLFEWIKSAEAVMEVHKSNGRSCIVYMGSMAVKVSQSLRRKDTFEVMAVPAAEIWVSLQEEGWIATDERNSREGWIADNGGKAE